MHGDTGPDEQPFQRLREGIPTLAGGDLDRALKIKANKFSAAAKAKIEAAGGTAEEVG
jgi:large subunit ribosomal protein L15